MNKMVEYHLSGLVVDQPHRIIQDSVIGFKSMVIRLCPIQRCPLVRLMR